MNRRKGCPKRVCLPLLATLVSMIISLSEANSNEMCWESCFQVEDEAEERFREVYDDFYRMGMEARRLKNMFGVNGTALLLDSTLSAFNPDDEFNPVYKVCTIKTCFDIDFKPMNLVTPS